MCRLFARFRPRLHDSFLYRFPPHSSQVIRCALENAASVAKTFLTSSVIVTEIPQDEPAIPGGAPGGDFGGY